MIQLVCGSQWGDEGKGKIIDYLSTSSDFVIRYHGGNNAGHTVINEYGTFPMHLVPSGIFSKRAVAAIAGGVVLDLEVLIRELDLISQAGIDLTEKFSISPRCHIIMPYHKVLDAVYEEAKGKQKTGTTGRGIGPVYADKVSYNGIRIYDLSDPERFETKLETQLAVKNRILVAFGRKRFRKANLLKEYLGYARKLKPYIRELFPMITDAIRKKKTILLEGAQGMYLDNDWGTYPFVTASTILTGGTNAASGIPAGRIDRIIGVAKAYTTRVGEGPFPTELTNATGDQIRQAGSEFGTTTGRPRRCGWLDLELIRFASEINGYTDIALTKLDILDAMPEIRVCTGYTYRGKPVRYVDGDAIFLGKVHPIYVTLPGWKQSTVGMTDFDALPKAAREYIRTIEKFVGIPVSYIGTGPERRQLIVRS